MTKDMKKPPPVGAAGGTSQSPQIEIRKCNGCGREFECLLITVAGLDFSRRYCDSCVEQHDRDEERKGEIARQAAIQEYKINWRTNSGLNQDLRRKTFANFEGGNRTVLRKASQWASEFSIEDPRGLSSLIFYSERPGLGKTHLMAAIANFIIENWDGNPEVGYKQPIRFESGPGLVRRIRATYNLASGINHEREEDVYCNLMGVRLLLLDDVGKEAPSRFTRETYWYLIDERLKSSLPVIISTRLQLNAMEELMGEDTVDRLYGMTRGEILELKGTSYRRRNLQP